MKKMGKFLSIFLGITVVMSVEGEAKGQPRKIAQHKPRKQKLPRSTKGRDIAPLLERRKVAQNLKTSIIIPCRDNHAYLLYPLLKVYEQQTVVPDEIVIALSEADKVPASIIEQLRSEKWPFLFQLLPADQKIWAGENRNRGCRSAHGDILICQDADDIPYPQRTEIIKYFFDHYNVDHLMHNFVYSREFSSFASYTVSQIRFRAPRSYIFDSHNHNGNVAISRYLFNKIQWPNDRKGQDVRFNRAVYRKYRRRILLPIPLILYKIELSSWKSLYRRIFEEFESKKSLRLNALS